MELLDQVRLSRRMPPPAMARAIRTSAGVSQERLAAELGVHRLTVIRWETGRCVPRGEVRARYAALLTELQRAVTAA